MTSRERIIITGASGHLGRLVAERVLESYAPDQVILVTRRPNVLNEFTARGEAVRAGDFDDPRSLPPALAGGRRMLIISTTDLNRRVNQHQAAIDAAAAAGVEHVIYTPMIAPSRPTLPCSPRVTSPRSATWRKAASRGPFFVTRCMPNTKSSTRRGPRPPGLSSTTAAPVPLPTCHALTARRWRWRS